MQTCTSIDPLIPFLPTSRKKRLLHQIVLYRRVSHVRYVNNFFFVSVREKPRDEGMYDPTTEKRTSLKTKFAFFQSYFVKVDELS